MLSASSTACLIDATVESMLTITPFLRPREGWVPTPMISRPSGPISPTTHAIFVVPMSSPTMMSEDLLGMGATHLRRTSPTAEIFYFLTHRATAGLNSIAPKGYEYRLARGAKILGRGLGRSGGRRPA